MTCPSVWRLSHPVRPGSNLKLNSKLFSRHGGFNWRDRKAEVFLPPIMFLPPIPNFHIRPQSFNIQLEVVGYFQITFQMQGPRSEGYQKYFSPRNQPTQNLQVWSQCIAMKWQTSGKVENFPVVQSNSCNYILLHETLGRGGHCLGTFPLQSLQLTDEEEHLTRAFSNLSEGFAD